MSINTKKKLTRATIKDLIAERGEKCECCGGTIMLTLDHIVPLHLLQNMGLTLEECYEKSLLMILCQPCNHVKSGRLDFANPRTKEILLKCLEKL